MEEKRKGKDANTHKVNDDSHQRKAQCYSVGTSKSTEEENKKLHSNQHVSVNRFHLLTLTAF
jgi:hypothetical protein